MRLSSFKSSLFLATALTLLASSSHAALFAYAELTLNGAALDGDVTMDTIGGVNVSLNHIEVYEFSQKQEVSSKNGRVDVGPLLLVKQQDSASPHLIRGLVAGDVIEGTIKFFGNEPNSGETRLETTIEILNGRIMSLETVLPNALNADLANRPPSDIVKIQAGSLIYTNVLSKDSATWTSSK